MTSEKVLTPDASAVKFGKLKGTSRKLNEPYFWRSERIRDILSDEVYTGLNYGNKTKKGKRLPKSEWKLSRHRHPGVIYKNEFELAQHRLQELSDRKILTQRKQEEHIYLLSSLLKCDHCRKLANPANSEMISWTGTGKELDKKTHQFSYFYKCGRKNKAKSPILCPVIPIPAQPLEESL